MPWATILALSTCSRGPGYSPPSMRWVTKQWDASAVVPAKDFYGIKAPGYDGVGTGSTANEFRFDCASTAAGALRCYCYRRGHWPGLQRWHRQSGRP